MSGKDWWNRNVFCCRRKEERDGADWMSLGRMFQKVEAATENERRPTVDRRYGGTSSCCVNEIKGYSYSLSHSRTLWWRVRWLKQCRLEVAAELQQWWRRTCDGVWRGAGLKIHDRNMTDHKLWHERRTDVSRKLQLWVKHKHEYRRINNSEHLTYKRFANYAVCLLRKMSATSCMRRHLTLIIQICK